MAQEKFTEAGELGKRTRSALGSAYRSAKSGVKRGYDYIEDVIKEYGQEPLLNLYPQAVNLTAAGTEFGMGLAGKPANLGRYPYYNIQTQFDEPQKIEAEPVNVEQKETQTITVSKPKAKPNLWRVMLEGEDQTKDLFADTEDDAKYLLKQMGGNGAVAGIRIGGKNKEEEEKLKEQYIQRASMGGKAIPSKTEEERLTRKLTEAGATPEQRDRYLKNLERLRSGREERELASKERASKFRSDIAAKRASEEQLNQYNKQLSTLKRAYREARMSGDYVEQYRIGDFINSYTAGVPKEMGARQKASQRGIIENRNKELAEMVRRDREARIAAERASRANPDYQQFNSQPTYQPTSYPQQFANNLTFSNL